MTYSVCLTVVFELTLALLLGVKGGRNIAVVILVNTLTNPIVNCIYIYVRYIGKYGNIISFLTAAVLEISAVMTEWLIYRSCTDIKKPFRLSLSANCFSFFMGTVINILR